MFSIYFLAHRDAVREREETISSSTSSSKVLPGNSIIELVLDVPRGGGVSGRAGGWGRCSGGGRAPARPAISPQAQVLGSTTVRVLEAISAQVRDCLSHSAHQIPSPPHSQLTSETLTRLIA